MVTDFVLPLPLDFRPPLYWLFYLEVLNHNHTYTYVSTFFNTVLIFSEKIKIQHKILLLRSI